MSPSKDEVTIKKFDDAVYQIRDADLLLWRRRGLIAIAGRGQHAHAEMAGRVGTELWSYGFVQFKGGRAKPLRSLVKKYPGRIDLYWADADGSYDEFNREEALTKMQHLVGQEYGYRNVLKTALVHLPIVRLFVRPNLDDDSLSTYPPFCSQGYAQATRLGGGIDVVNNLADELVEPADLARSIFFTYAFTLVP